jgi:hypothetical protein
MGVAVLTLTTLRDSLTVLFDLPGLKSKVQPIKTVHWMAITPIVHSSSNLSQKAHRLNIQISGRLVMGDFNPKRSRPRR